MIDTGQPVRRVLVARAVVRVDSQYRGDRDARAAVIGWAAVRSSAVVPVADGWESAGMQPRCSARPVRDGPFVVGGPIAVHGVLVW
jgi:hypothetical protein